MIRHNHHFHTLSEVFLIAEIEVNHNGDMYLEKKLIKTALIPVTMEIPRSEDALVSSPCLFNLTINLNDDF